jgi:hypothetical protein
MYLSGVFDAHMFLADMGEMPRRQFCVPESENVMDLLHVYIKYANESPQRLHLTASSIAINAFTKAWPCE